MSQPDAPHPDPSLHLRRIVELLLFRVVPAGLVFGTAFAIGLSLLAGIPGMVCGLLATALVAGLYTRHIDHSVAVAVACSVIALVTAGFGFAIVAVIDLAVVCHHRVC